MRGCGSPATTSAVTPSAAASRVTPGYASCPTPNRIAVPHNDARRQASPAAPGVVMPGRSALPALAGVNGGHAIPLPSFEPHRNNAGCCPRANGQLSAPGNSWAPHALAARCRHSVPSMALGGLDPAIGTAENYREFAREARGRSPAYDSLATLVAGDDAVRRLLGPLPPPKRPPNLLFAAARYRLGPPPDITALRALVSETPEALAQVMLARRTQTNEPARCATLLPALAQLPPPLALIEVGASAGLTLLFDRYSYDYSGHLIPGSDPDAPTLRCVPRGPVPLPGRLPVIAWRAGLDLNPLDVTDDDDVHWLSCLVWPGEGDREERLAAAVAAARRDPPAIYRGDLLTDLPALAAQAPAGATLVI